MCTRPARRIRQGRLYARCPFLSVLLIIPIPALAQNEIGLSVRRSHSNQTIFVTSQDGGPIQVRDANGVASSIQSPEVFLDSFGPVFGVRDRLTQLTAGTTDRDALGQTHSTYRQVHSGLPVFGGQLRVHRDDQGQVVAVNGHFFAIPDNLNVKPALRAEEAISRAALEFEAANPQANRADLLIVDPGWYGDPPIGPRLAFHIELEDATGLNAEAFFVDAITGKILDRWLLVERAKSREIYDGGATTSLPGTVVRTELGPPPQFPIDANRAFHYYGDTYDYYWRAFGRDSMDNHGMAMVATVNSLAPGCPNAFWSSSLRQMAFCTGTVTDDITAHELTHGVTSFTADLMYQNQSGQLNESFSDVFGELVDLFNGDAAFALDDGGPPWPQNPIGSGLDELNSLRTECSPNSDYFDGVRWLIGEDSYAFGGALRDMWDPTCHSDPDRALSPLQTCGPGDNGGVHSGSGIPNHAFAMVVDGTEFNGYVIRGIGPVKAGAVWYRALTTYLTPTSDFEDAYVAFNRSAHDLVGTYPNDPRTGLPSSKMFSTDDAIQVDQSLRAVEMDGTGRCGQTVPIISSAPPPGCGNEHLIYSDDFENGIRGWSVSNSNPPTPYDWHLTDRLPLDRPGTGWMCDDPDIGDCNHVDESALHSLISPPIILPLDGKHPMLRFTHHVDTESGWDGGVLAVRVNGGRWQNITGQDFHYNGYNTRLRKKTDTNLNPLGGREAWSGIGAEWGTSVIELGELARPGDTLEIRFDFGKDGCAGRRGWFIDDVQVYACPDCNFNGQSDDVDLTFRRSSGAMPGIGVGVPRRFVLTNPPPSSEDVRLQFAAVADLAGEVGDEHLFVSMNGEPLGTIFSGNASDCPSSPNSDVLTVPRERFNLEASSGAITLDISATDAVNPVLCGGTSWIRVDVAYKTTSVDQNGNQIPDECESCDAVPSPSLAANPASMNRYIAFTPRAGTQHVAYRVRVVEGSGVSAHLAPQTVWIGPLAPGSGGHGTSWRAGLQCQPYFSDQWDTGEPVFVSSNWLSPEGVYLVDAIEVGCWSLIDGHVQSATTREMPGIHFSKPITLATSPWGDVAGKDNSAPDGVVDMLDVTAVLDRFRNLAGAVEIHRADLSPAVPDGVVDFSDISQVINAFRGEPYPFASDPPDCSQRPR